MALCIEAGKPIHDARGEVTRLIDTFRIAAEESVRIYGEVMPLDISPRAEGYSGMWKRVPHRPLLVHQPVQFSAQPGRPQGRARHRRRLPVRAQARQPHADRRADHRRDPGRDRSARRAPFRSCPAAATAPACSPPTNASSCSASPARPTSAGSSRPRPARRRSCSNSAATPPCIVDEDADLEDAVARIIFGAFYQ